MKNLLIFWLMLGAAFSALPAQQLTGQGTLEINFLEGGKVVHTLSTDQLVVYYDADQAVLRFLVKPAALAVGGTAFDQSVVEEVLQSPANRLMMIQGVDLNLPIGSAQEQTLSSSLQLSYQSRNLERPGVLRLKPADRGLQLEADLVTNLEALGLYLPAAFESKLGTDLQIRMLNVSLSER